MNIKSDSNLPNLWRAQNDNSSKPIESKLCKAKKWNRSKDNSLQDIKQKTSKKDYTKKIQFVFYTSFENYIWHRMYSQLGTIEKGKICLWWEKWHEWNNDICRIDTWCYTHLHGEIQYVLCERMCIFQFSWDHFCIYEFFIRKFYINWIFWIDRRGRFAQFNFHKIWWKIKGIENWKVTVEMSLFDVHGLWTWTENLKFPGSGGKESKILDFLKTYLTDVPNLAPKSQKHFLAHTKKQTRIKI